MLKDKEKKQIKEVFDSLIDPVHLIIFLEEGSYGAAEVQELVKEITELSDKLSYEVVEDKEDPRGKLAEIKLFPSIAFFDAEGNYLRVKFNGFPGGHEINSFLQTIMDLSGGLPELPLQELEYIEGITKAIEIKVFVTLACPHCSGAVLTANRIAKRNQNVKAEMIDAGVFLEESNRHNVSSVPKIIFNDHYEIVGNQPISEFFKIFDKMESE